MASGVQKDEFLVQNNIKAPTFYRYIQYIKESGFIIKNKKGFYKIYAFRKKDILDKKDEMIFANILFLAQNYLSKQKSSTILETMTNTLQNYEEKSYTNIKNLFDELKIQNLKQDIKNKIEQFQNYINCNKIVEITTKNNKNFLIKPKEIIFEKDEAFVKFFDKKEKTDNIISLNSIKKVIIMEENIITNNNTTETIFELNNKLSKSYILKENERIVDKYPNKLIVANSSNNKKDLFKRLLRYDVYCKILFPKQDVESFKNFVKQSIENINS